MAIEDIERLKEKIARDPNSKLFVPLAEEYKKSGMFDEAIDTLIKGLEQQPGYLSARVSLGKIYIERGMLAEARDEFEKVINAIPDNLYAHKKLAEIYRELGDREKAVQEFRKVLKLNPMDDWATTSLSELQKNQASDIVSPTAKDIQESLPEELPAGVKFAEETAPAAAPPAELPSYGDKDLWDIPPEIENEVTREQPPEIPLTAKDREITEALEKEEDIHGEISAAPPGNEDTETLTGIGSEAGKVPDEDEWDKAYDFPSGEEEGIDLWKESSGGGGDSPVQDEPAEAPISREDLDLWKSLKDAEDASDEPAPEAGEIDEGSSFSFEDIIEEAEPAEAISERAAAHKEGIPGKTGDMLSQADRWISEGNYTEAMGIYREILTSEPDNRNALQRAEELKALLKLLGKEKEELIERLETLLQGIKKRRDEFSGTA